MGCIYNEIYLSTGQRIVVEYDDYAENPRKSFDCSVAHFRDWHSRYDIGDYTSGKSNDGCNDAKVIKPDDDFEYLYIVASEIYKVSRDEELNAVFRRLRQAVEDLDEVYDDAVLQRRKSALAVRLRNFIKRFAVVLPLYMLDHSGVSISTRGFADSWDSGQVGFVFLLKKKYLYSCTTKRNYRIADIEKCIEGEVEMYNQYLRGEVYSITVIDAEGNEDTVCGYYGDDAIEQGIFDIGTFSDAEKKEIREKF